MIHFLYNILIIFFLIFSLLSTIKYSIIGIVEFPNDNKIINFCSHYGWIIVFGLFFGLGAAGQYGRGELSASPFITYKIAYLENGLYNAIIGVIIVIITDLWLFWTSANLFIHSDREIRLLSSQKTMARTINLLVGLLLITEGNPLYIFAELLVPS